MIYKTQKRNQRLRGHGRMPYSKQTLISWCKRHGFDELFKAWVASGYQSRLKPSVDRINDFYGYSLDNIRLVTWQENRNHQRLDIMNGFGTGGQRCKPVLKLDSDRNVIQEYPSYSSAKRDVGYCMAYAINHCTQCKEGFFWKYKDCSSSLNKELIMNDNIHPEHRDMVIEEVARIAHELNAAYCKAIGDDPQLPWSQSPKWQQESAINGVKFHLEHPHATPQQSHENWLAEKLADGWVYGEVKDTDAKTHPCCIAYEQLPVEQRAKDYIFRQTVHSVTPRLAMFFAMTSDSSSSGD